MVKFNIIVCTNKQGIIGCNNDLYLKCKEDMKHFANITKGNGNNVVVMGHNTWNSIPDNKKPLVNREKIIMSKNKDCTSEKFKYFLPII